jgi:hypothetical protein
MMQHVTACSLCQQPIIIIIIRLHLQVPPCLRAAPQLCCSFYCRHSRSRRKKHIIIIRKTLTPTSEQLSRLPLRPGSNTITFRCEHTGVDGVITRDTLVTHW